MAFSVIFLSARFCRGSSRVFLLLKSCFALQWSSSTLLWDFAAWRTSWRTRSRALAWRRRPWGSYWISWINKKRKSTKSRISWRVSWKIEHETPVSTTCSHSFFLSCFVFVLVLVWLPNTNMEISFKYQSMAKFQSYTCLPRHKQVWQELMTMLFLVLASMTLSVKLLS